MFKVTNKNITLTHFTPFPGGTEMEHWREMS